MSKLLSATAGLAALLMMPAGAYAQADNSYLGEVRPWANNFCPRGWSTTNGQLLSISQFTALFSLLGTAYGGDGRTTFALPNLQGRTLVGWNSPHPGLTTWTFGEFGGFEFNPTAITHTHSLMASADPVGAPQPEGNSIPDHDTFRPYQTNTSTNLVPMGGGAITSTGQPVNNRQPSLALYYCISMDGLFPSRN